MHFEHATVATIKDVQAYGSNGMIAISFEETLAPRSARQPQGFPIELALMQRNIKFESDSDEKTQGGHLMVFQTGAVYQHLEGVELYHFGQRGVLGRYVSGMPRALVACPLSSSSHSHACPTLQPMHIHLCEYLSAGTTFKRNFVHQSNQRCMIIHGSHNATIEENVAYESFGHCFMLEDGAEIDNRFIRNLGASQHNVEEEELVRDGESDDHSSTYWCTNPMNTWIDNVAAGGEGSGFWFEMKHDVKAPSIPVTEGPLFELNLTRFESNIAHSYRSNGLRTYPDGYRPIHRARFVDTRSYKNWDDGIFFHNSWNLGVYGGIVADNRRQIQIHRADNVIIEDVDVIGQTRAHHDALNREDGWGHCPSSWSSLYGITIHSFLFNNESPRGPTLRNVRISNINDHDSGCEDTAAIYMHEDEIQPTFDSWTLFDGLTFTDIGTKFSICEAVSQGVKSVIMEVTDNSMGSGPGFILSENQPEMVKFIPANSCTQMSEACAIFCTGVCLRTLKFKVEPTISPDMSLRVQSVASGDVIEVPGLVQGDDPTRTWTYRTYSVVLPAGDYNIAFVENGVQTWPTVVFEEMGDEPECNQDGSWTYTLAQPTPPAGFCDTLISDTVKNGDIEDGLDYWKHWWQGINITQDGFQSTHALTTQRQDSNYFGQFLDTRCMQAGQQYQIEARVRIVNANGETVACNPNSNDWSTRCAYATIYSRFEEPVTGDQNEDWHRVGQTIASTSTSDWKVLHGAFTVTHHMDQSTEVFLYFEGVPEYLWVDNVRVTKFDRTGLPVILNGDFDTHGDHRYFQRGWNDGLVMTTPGAEGTAAAVKTDAVGGYVEQYIPPIQPNSRYFFTAKYKLDSPSGTCPPEVWWRDDACPKLILYSGFENETLNEWKGYQFAVAPVTANAWNTMAGYFTSTQAQATADWISLHVAHGPVNAALSLDSISLTKVPSDCTRLIDNGGVESGDTRGWLPRGAGVQLQIEPTGTDGAALAARQRTSSWHGIYQQLDLNCVEFNSGFSISMYIKLWDSALNAPHNCTVGQRWGDQACPVVGIEAEAPDDGGWSYLSLDNEETSAWIPGQFNLFTADFDMTQQMEDAVAVNFYIERPPAGIDIIVDQVIVTKLF
jgi:hypothetical protein